MIERHFNDHSTAMSFTGYFHRDKPVKNWHSFSLDVEPCIPNLGSNIIPNCKSASSDTC